MATASVNLSEFSKEGLPNAKGQRFALVVADWNGEITDALAEGARETLEACGADPGDIERVAVPGSFELPFGCKRMLESGRFDAVIAIGSVIRGETSHFDYVCSATALGIKDLNLQFPAPTIFCVLTDDTHEQARDRSGGRHGNKGVEAAVAAIRMAALPR